MDKEMFDAWMSRERERSYQFSVPDSPTPAELRRFYPEWDFDGLYTTSLEPHTPLWVQLPFYEKINVGINLRLENVQEFEEIYSVKPSMLLDLYDEGRVNIRLLYPQSDIQPAEFYEPFISEDLPSSMRDWAYTEKLLGSSTFEDLQSRFESITGYKNITQPLDEVGQDSDRAQQNMWAVYSQLQALGYRMPAKYFEELIEINEDLAWNWMEACRQFLIGPIHYSFGGVHSVSPHNEIIKNGSDSVETFPVDIGEVLVNKLDLVQQKPEIDSVEDSLSIYDDHEVARNALWELKNAVEETDPSSVEEARQTTSDMIDDAIEKHKSMTTSFRVIAATGVNSLGLLSPTTGLLAALGYDISESVTGGKISEAAVRKFEDNILSPHLTTVIGLWQDTK